MNFTEHKDMVEHVSANDVNGLLTSEQRQMLQKAANQYELYAGDNYRHDGIEADDEMTYEEKCDEADGYRKDQALEAFFKTYPDSESFSFQLKLIMEDMR